ncbi:hypothetical protein C1645_838110 [Glomus cerebriforme]|uniref:Uncharacterized protein n=1 Tax=Glomus cerebriforme TaxID=658196 RepID=A0A397S7Q5_9GLOM|nr:hypothetical protein C1645_838110 [Glomus cerebriforme]
MNQAIYWFEKSANQGFEEAQNKLKLLDSLLIRPINSAEPQTAFSGYHFY